MSDELQPEGVERNMKPALATLVQEAVCLALIDSAVPHDEDGKERFWTDEERQAMEHDIFAMPGEALAEMDPIALAQNVAVRLLGRGGWELPTIAGPIYTGNATAREVWEASLARPDRSIVDEMAFDLGLTPAEEEARDDG